LVLCVHPKVQEHQHRSIRQETHAFCSRMTAKTAVSMADP
jgi:hypothetical protein